MLFKWEIHVHELSERYKYNRNVIQIVGDFRAFTEVFNIGNPVARITVELVCNERVRCLELLN